MEIKLVTKIEGLIGVAICLILLWAVYNGTTSDSTVSNGVNYFNSFGIPLGLLLILIIPLMLYIAWKEMTSSS